jgi:hypothetical protein
MFELSEHFPIGVNRNGDGPVDENEPDYLKTVCWCADPDCRKHLETT